MPLPLIPIAVAIAAGGSAILAGYKGKEAYDNYKKAGELIKQQKATIKLKAHSKRRKKMLQASLIN